ncbi:Uncharacterised protein [Mycobacteroides abscessus]|nr:Uncharacterised protein [Mycobacteroides abscessus]
MFVTVTTTGAPAPTVTSVTRSSPTVSTGVPQSTPRTVGRSVSVRRTTVPTGRSCGPSTTWPSARTVSVPVTGSPSRSNA